MFCAGCGEAITQKDMFCSHCGKRTLQKTIISSKEKPLLNVKPVLIGWVVLARYIPMQLNITICGAALLGVLNLFIQLYRGNIHSLIEPFLYPAIFIFLLVPLVVYFIYVRSYSQTIYNFYSDHLEYYEGFWTIERKVILYKNITQVSIKRNVIQRFYHLGTLHFAVANLSAKDSGIVLVDVPNPETLYQKLQPILQIGVSK